MGIEMSIFLFFVIDYKCDDFMYVRKLYDIVVNSFGRKFLQFCCLICIRVCNGCIVGDKEGRYIFFNYIGVSVNDFVLVIENYFYIIDYFQVDDFNEWFDYVFLYFYICVNRYVIFNVEISNVNMYFIRIWWDELLYDDIRI